ncbi:hypothetical protein PUN28_008248 [Cardiocondyla obscurior]|uniref:Uncharacterized protein n=1 Tax=Cardiocondyla obscurior TaxID=286306 RepID=A0AAW2G2Z6_9HYME
MPPKKILKKKLYKISEISSDLSALLSLDDIHYNFDDLQPHLPHASNIQHADTEQNIVEDVLKRFDNDNDDSLTKFLQEWKFINERMKEYLIEIIHLNYEKEDIHRDKLKNRLSRKAAICRPCRTHKFPRITNRAVRAVSDAQVSRSRVGGAAT